VITALVTGADRGIGRAMVELLARRGDRPIAACLLDGEDLCAAGIHVVPRIDVTSATDVARLAATLRAGGTSLDWLVNNAGVLGLDQLGSIDYEDVRRQLEINTIGPLRVTEALLDLLAPSAKVAITTSRVGSLGDNASGGMYAYRLSKAAANMVGLNLHHDLSRRGIAVLMNHPGMVATDLTRDFPRDLEYLQPEEAAAGIIRNIDALTLDTSGRFQHSNGDYLPW
jgi:NAD(P)-dependent dehydrogenase (short-subunit alcohol dehydrogenase family)